jgi:hypothetical protein
MLDPLIVPTVYGGRGHQLGWVRATVENGQLNEQLAAAGSGHNGRGIAAPIACNRARTRPHAERAAGGSRVRRAVPNPVG